MEVSTFPVRLYLTRHGITKENKLSILQGQIDTNLDEDGIAQSKLLGIGLTDLKFTHIYASPLKRALHTAQFAIENMKYKLEPILDDRLKERGFGSWEGKPKSERLGPKPPDLETHESVIERVSSFFRDLNISLAAYVAKNRSENGSENVIFPTVLLVSHGATYRRIEDLMCQWGAKISEDIPIFNTALSLFDVIVDSKGVVQNAKCVLSRDTSHLQGKFVLKWD